MLSDPRGRFWPRGPLVFNDAADDHGCTGDGKTFHEVIAA
jgi:hypothetical protein